MPNYNLSGIQNATNPAQLLSAANDAVSGLLVGGFVISIFIIMLMSLKRYPFNQAFLSSSFTAFVLSSIFAYGGFLNIIFPLTFLILASLTAFIMFVLKR